MAGPLAAACFAFRDFDALDTGVTAAVRSYTIPDPVFGPVVFVAVLAQDGEVEIADFVGDPSYWDALDDDFSD